jgi:tetratricopeptide (TPR) repeat protein
MAKRPQKKKSRPETGQGNVAEAKGIPSGKWSGVGRATLLQALTIAAAVLWIYWPALHGGWLWDDDVNITDNAITQSPTGLWSIWFEPGRTIDYYPIKASAQWIQWHLWGMNTLGYHLTNVGLHLIGALLVWRLLSKFHLRLAWVGGLIFAIHPVQVESVAWISELKNTLSLPPFLLAMCAWIDYEERGKAKDYGLALGLFLVAMLCKPAMVMFPGVILLYAWWKRGRIGWNDLQISTPFFVVSLALGLITVWIQHHTATQQAVVSLGGIFSRLADAGLALSFYFSKCFLPVELMPVYPQWTVDSFSPLQLLPWPVLGGVTWLWTKRRTWGRHALLGLGFFLLLLAPFLGFHAISYMAFTWVMDHFLYLPIIGLIGLAVAALGRIEERLPASFRFCGIGLVTVVMACLAFESRSYAKMFINSETLWTYELQHNPEAYPAHNNLGKVLLENGQVSKAREQLEEALRIYPDDIEAHNNLGVAFADTGQLTEAMEQDEAALRLKPDYAEAHNNLGETLAGRGRLPEAVDQYETALRLKPDYAEARNNLGDVLLQTGRVADATEQYETALRLKPDYADAHYNLGNIFFQTGRGAEAMDQYETALRLKPDDAKARYNLGTALLQSGRIPEAIGQFQAAIQINPDYAEPHNNLGNALLQTGRIPEALGQFQAAIRIKPDYAEAQNNLGYVLAQTGRWQEAINRYQEAVRLNPDYAQAHVNWGNALLQMGRRDEAQAHFERALQIDPGNQPAQKALKTLNVHGAAGAKPAPAPASHS